MRETLRIWTARMLLGFVLITIGFAAGRRTAPVMGPSAVDEPLASGGPVGRVVVYAAHMTFRCQECTRIEWLARELVESEYSGLLSDGRLEFRTVDYMRDKAFAAKYDIPASTIVVVRIEEGQEQEFQRLDEVWTKIHNQDEYFDYLRSAINDYLGKEKVE